MSVVLYSGVPGSGKSLHATARIIEYLSMGRDVISNYPVKFTKREIKKGYPERFQFVPDENMTNRFLIQNSLLNGYSKKRKEKQCLLVIDEAAQMFNCRDFGDKARRKWLDFFRIHRKLGYDVVLVSQQDKMIDKQIRGIIEREFHHRKCSNIFWWFALFPVQLHVAKEYFYGMTPKTAIGATWFRYKKALGARYDTFALFDSLEGYGEIETANNNAAEEEQQEQPGQVVVRGRGSLARTVQAAKAALLDNVSFTGKGGKPNKPATSQNEGIYTKEVPGRPIQIDSIEVEPCAKIKIVKRKNRTTGKRAI